MDKKILLVEDDIILGETIHELLESENYKVTWVKDGQEALEETYNNSFDIFLFDLNVPFVNGLELLDELRKSGDKTPAIIVTANVDIKSTNQNLGYGLFAKQNIAKNSFVGEFAGVLKKRSSASLKVNHYCLKYPIEGGVFQKYTIDASKKGNCFRFLNHNINPNLDVRSVFYNGFK